MQIATWDNWNHDLTMTFWQARSSSREHDQLLTSLADSDDDHATTITRQRMIRKAASMATLSWPRPASSPAHAVGTGNTPVQDRSPFPPRISSLNRVPLPGWDSNSDNSSPPIPPKSLRRKPTNANANAKRPATSHVSTTSTTAEWPLKNDTTSGAEMPPGTAHALVAGTAGIGRARGASGSQGTHTSPTLSTSTALPRPRTSHHLDTTSSASYTLSGSEDSESFYQFAITRRSSSLFALETATASLPSHSPSAHATNNIGVNSGSSAAGNANALMPASAYDLRNSQNTSHSSSSPRDSKTDSSHSAYPYPPIYSSYSSQISQISPTMRKASPMPQALSTSPWQHTTNNLTSPTDSNTPPPGAGKTSQVLAKLTAECDRLRREIRAEKAAKEEAVQQFQALKTRVGWLEEKKSMLSMQLDTNENALARKERRLDDLKSSLEEEVARRKRAEEREAEMGRKLGETVSQAAEEVSNANMARKNAETAYSTLENEYAGLTRRIAFLRKEVDTLTSKINENSAVHKKQVLQLEVLVEQLRGSQEKSEKQVHEMGRLLQSYWDTEENTKRLETEMQEAVHEMRWVMRLHESREGQARAEAAASTVSAAPAVQPASRHAKINSTSSVHVPKSPKQRRKQIPSGVPI